MANSSLILTVILILPSVVCAVLPGGTINVTTFDQQVNLTCHLNLSQNVEWSVYSRSEFLPIFICQENMCSRKNGRFSENSTFLVHQSEATSTFSLSRAKRAREICQCKPVNYFTQTYDVRFVDSSEVISPHCTVSPRAQNGRLRIKLSCEFDGSKRLNTVLAFEGIGDDISDSHRTSRRIKKTIEQKTFLKIEQEASCKLSIPGTLINRSCTYPKPLHVRRRIEKDSMIFQCDVELEGDVVTWRLLDSELLPEDIKNRSWTRDAGRSLLIQILDFQDGGKIVECRTYKDHNQSRIDAIGFAVVPPLTRETQESAWLEATMFNLILVVAVAVCVTVILLYGLWLIYRHKSRRQRESFTLKSLKSPPVGDNPSSEPRADLIPTPQVPLSPRSVVQPDGAPPNRYSWDDVPEYLNMETSDDQLGDTYENMPKLEYEVVSY